MNTKGFEAVACLCLVGIGRMLLEPQDVPHYWTVYVAALNGTVEENGFGSVFFVVVIIRSCWYSLKVLNNNYILL